MVGVVPSCALLGGFAIGARISLLWQHSANAKCQRVLVLVLFLVVVHWTIKLLSTYLLFTEFKVQVRSRFHLCWITLHRTSALEEITTGYLESNQAYSEHKHSVTFRVRVITFRVSRRRREMYCGHPRLCVSVCPRPHAYTIERTRM